MSERLIKFLIIALFFSLSGCQTGIIGNTSKADSIDETSENDAVSSESYLVKSLEGFFSKLFEENQVQPELQTSSMSTEETKDQPNFKMFSAQNTYINLNLSLSNSPIIKSKLFRIEAIKAELGELDAAKLFTSQISAIGGAVSEDRDTEIGASLQISSRKLLYDGKSSDFQILSKLDQLESAKHGVLVAADQEALKAIQAWINLKRYQEIEQIFQVGFSKLAPLVEQVESVSLSGMSDRKQLLLARRSLADLENKFIISQSMTATAEESFRDSFPSADLKTVTELPMLKIDVQKISKGFSPMQTNLVQEQVYLQQGIVKQIQALVASEKPVVAFSATVNAPVRDTLDDGTANAGLRLTYNLNDGGSLEAKIARGKAELEVMRNEIAALKKSLNLEYHKNKLNYQTSEKRVESLKEMIILAEETQEVTKQQVVAGRSTIKDVLDGEVLLSSLRIDLINGQSESILALVALEGFSTGLSESLGWSY